MSVQLRSLVVCVLSALAACAVAAPLSTAAPAHPADRDGNRLFDDLDRALLGKPADDRLDVIVLFAGGDSRSQVASARRAVGSFRTGYEYRSIPAVAADLSAGQIRALAARDEVRQIQLDRKMTFEMDSARAAFGTDKAQLDFAVDGNNELGSCPDATSYCADDVVVAVLDSGVDPTHVDLDGGKVLKSMHCADLPCISGAIGTGSHGTHVGSIIAGEGEANPANRGVAPGAALVNVDVGMDAGANQSAVDAGLEWILANKDTYGIDVMNASLASTGLTDGTDSTSRLINRAVAAGISTFVSAGNAGPAAATVSSPGVAKFALTVGAMNDLQDADYNTPLGFNLAPFSSRGPTSDGRTKPDIAAPGVHITAAEYGYYGNNWSHTSYATHSGTSMSSPFAAGVGALMLDADPSLVSAGTACAGDDTSVECNDGVVDASMSFPLKDKLQQTALDWGPAGPDSEYGFGRLDAYAAIDAASALVGTGGPGVPRHTFSEGSLSGTGAVADHPISVTNTNYPISITLVMPSWTGATTPDFAVTLLDPSGAQVAANTWRLDIRQENLGFMPTVAGTYTVRVRSVAGSGPYWFDASFSGDPPPPPPTPPLGLTATAASSTQVNLAWIDATGETAYRVERSTDGVTGWTQIAAPAANATSYSDTGLTPATTYHYRVKAVNAGGESLPSNVAAATTTSDSTPPTAPTGLTAKAGKGSVSLSWVASSDPGGSGLAGYEVWRRTGTSGAFSKIATTTAPSYTNSGLKRGTVYYYYVVAYDQAGNRSAASNTASAKAL